MSTQFTEHDIETLPQWNAVLTSGCCCEMPSCPVPAMQCESLSGTMSSEGYFDSGATLWTIYAKKVDTTSVVISYDNGFTVRSGSGIEEYTYEWTEGPFSAGSGIFGGVSGPCPQIEQTAAEETFFTEASETGSFNSGGGDPLITSWTRTRTQTGGSIPGEAPAWTDLFVFTANEDPPGNSESTTSNSLTTTYAGDGSVFTSTSELLLPFTYDEWVTAALAKLTEFETASGEGGGCWGTECEATYSVTPEDTSAPYNGEMSLTRRRVRFRWQVPDTHLGTYFKVTWDIIEEPDGWDDEVPTVFRSFVSTNNTWEWTGPGDPEDPDSWLSDWFDIDPPETPGSRRVVNIRFECYRGPYGNRPQTTGEGVELPE